MSFISILKTVGSTLLGIEHVAEPIVETLFPASSPIFAIFDKVQTAITTVEQGMPAATGAAKAQAVVNDFEAGLALTQQILAVDGKTLSYDTTALQTAIDAQVAAYNAFAAVKASFKVVVAVPAKT
jgi:hypothetical protein